jgi:hypothetical protein
MTEVLNGPDAVIAWIDETIANVEGLVVSWSNTEFIGMLSQIRAGLAVRPTWAEVSISEVLAERDELKCELVRARGDVTVQRGIAAQYTERFWTAVGERDRARATAVRLEQELAEREAEVHAAWVQESRMHNERDDAEQALAKEQGR